MFMQSLVIQPRSGHTRVAKTDTSQRTIGGDGKLYKLVDSSDEHKFRIMSEEDMLLEARKAQDIAATIRSTKKVIKNGTRQVKRATQSPNKEQRIENKKWRQTVDSIKQAPVVSPASSPTKPIVKVHEPIAKVVSMDEPAVVPDALLKAMTLLQTKYEKNLEVIDILFQEKKQMEEKVSRLESKLVENSSKFENSIGLVSVRNSTDSNFILPKSSEEVCTPSMAASLFGDTAVNNVPDNLPAPRARPQSASIPRGRAMNNMTSSSVVYSTDDHNITRNTRSVSCDSRRSAGSFNQSVQMQASIDRYIQKKALIEQKDKEQILQQKEYEQQQRERYLRVSINLMML